MRDFRSPSSSLFCSLSSLLTLQYFLFRARKKKSPIQLKLVIFLFVSLGTVLFFKSTLYFRFLIKSAQMFFLYFLKALNSIWINRYGSDYPETEIMFFLVSKKPNLNKTGKRKPNSQSKPKSYGIMYNIDYSFGLKAIIPKPKSEKPEKSSRL